MSFLWKDISQCAKGLANLFFSVVYQKGIKTTKFHKIINESGELYVVYNP